MTPVDNRVRLEASFIVLVGLLGEEKCDTRLLEIRVRLEASFVVLVGLLGEEKCGKQTSAGCPDCSQSKNATHFVTYETTKETKSKQNTDCLLNESVTLFLTQETNQNNERCASNRTRLFTKRMSHFSSPKRPTKTTKNASNQTR